MRRSFAIISVLVVLILGVILGAIGLSKKEVGEVSWGILVPGYMFFAMTAAGAALVTLAPSLFGYEGSSGELKSLRKLALWFAAGTLIPSWFLILLDLSRPAKFVDIFIGFNPSSRIAWMAALYSMTFVVLIIELLYAIIKEERTAEGLTGKSAWVITLTLIGTVVELMLISNLSQVFGVIQTFPAWHGAYLVPIFIVTSFILGASGMGIFVVLSMKNREKETKFAASYYGKMIISNSLVLALLLFWAMLSAYFDPEAWASFSQMLKGSYSAMFWCAAVLGFLISPAVAGIAVRRKNTTAIVASSIISLLFGFTILYLIVVVPQTVYFDVLAGVVNERVYSIGAGELLIAVGGLLIWLSLISLGYLLLPLLPEERAKKLLIFK